MLRKKTIAIWMVFIMIISIICKTTPIYADASEETNLKLNQEELRSIEMLAGDTIHLSIELLLKEGYCIKPIFTITSENNESLSFENISVKNAGDKASNKTIFINDSNSSVILEYDILVDDFAAIGEYEYAISYYPKDGWDEDEEKIEPGKLIMKVIVTGEKEPPQLSITSDLEFHCNAGETIDMTFTLKNEGELQALNTYVFADYSAYSDILIPAYTPLNQKIGNINLNETEKVSISYKVSEDAPTQRIKIPLEIDYKMANGKSDTSVAYLYLYIEGKPEPTLTPTPTPVIEPEEKVVLLLNTVKQSPASPKAEQKVTVSFNLENKGNTVIENIKVAPVNLSSAGFEPVNSEPYQYIESIAVGAKKQVTLTLKVGKEIKEGLNTLDVSYSYEVNGVEQKETVTLYILNVQSKQEEEVVEVSRPKLMVSDFYTDVEDVKAGNVFDFTFDILNTNDSIDAKNIKVTVTGASNAFSVTAGGNSFFVNEIKPQEKASITINLKASAAVTTGAYPINIKIEYEYEGMVATSSYSGELVEEQILLQVKENLRPSVENVYIGSWDTPMLNQPTTLSFEFYNMGKSTLNNTYITIEGDFTLSNGSNSYYIGNISAGMPEYIEFEVVPIIEGNAVGKMIIHMEDSNGDEVTMEKEFTTFVMGEMSWEDPGIVDPGYMEEPSFEDPSSQTIQNKVFHLELTWWMLLLIQVGIMVIVIPVTRAIYLSIYKRKIKKEDAE